MRIVGRIADLRRALGEERRLARTVGFVPTMGYLHEGHLSLMRRARAENQVVVISVFVNPLQFGPSEDFERYPRDMERDARMAEEVGVDYLFAPAVEEMYPDGRIETRVEVGRIGEVGEGRFRPGHFAGVATVCVKLFGIVGCDRAYFGEKDLQQLAVIRQVVRDLDLPLTIVGCPALREPDGLVMSSRNGYLGAEERTAAAALSEALFAARERVAEGERSAEKARRLVEEHLASEPRVRTEYVEVVDPDTLEPLDEIRERAAITLAAFVGSTRLIDSVVVNVGTGQPA